MKYDYDKNIIIYSQFIYLEATFFFTRILVATASIIDALWYIFVSIIVTGYGRKTFLIEKKILIQKITGIVLIFISIALLFKIIS